MRKLDVMRRILVADDDTAMRELIQATLEDPQFEITLAVNGLEALQKAITQLPDAIILDWEMPKMTGAEVVTQLRLRPETAKIPVLMLTGRGQDGNDGLKLGITAYLIKPFSPLLLLECLNTALASSSKSVAAAKAGRRK